MTNVVLGGNVYTKLTVRVLLREYPLKNNTTFLRRVAHSAMIGKEVSYLKNGTVVIANGFSSSGAYATAEYWSRRMLWC